jgi:hypothetical protein
VLWTKKNGNGSRSSIKNTCLKKIYKFGDLELVFIDVLLTKIIYLTCNAPKEYSYSCFFNLVGGLLEVVCLWYKRGLSAGFAGSNSGGSAAGASRSADPEDRCHGG